LYVLVDTKTMRIKNVLADPTPEYFETVAAEELALLDGVKPPPPVQEVLIDGFSAEIVDMLQGMRTPGAPPADPTNAVADSAPAASLGAKLFGDAKLSPSGTVSCATCHDKTKAFTDGLPQSVGVAKVDRNAPALGLAAHFRWQFWDGRADTLWMQALGPFEDDKEMAGDRLFVAHQIFDRYKADYEAAFANAPLPNLGDTAKFPARGKPGQAAWDAMATADRDAVTQVFVNVGKSIAAFERTFRIKPTKLDQYLDGDKQAFDDEGKRAIREYFSVGCAQCHFGPTLTNDAFFVTRFPTGRQDKAPDVGREAGYPKLSGSEFNSNGRWSDAKSARNLSRVPPGRARGAFKTPTLRGSDVTGPFGHGGTIPTLAEVVELYGKRGLHDGHEATVGFTEPYLPKFDEHLQQHLPIFLKLLRAENAP
jgi:cytochrome c peroxidase